MCTIPRHGFRVAIPDSCIIPFDVFAVDELSRGKTQTGAIAVIATCQPLLCAILSNDDNDWPVHSLFLDAVSA